MLYKRPNSKKWWVRFTAPDGSELRRSTGTEDKRAAQEWEDRLKACLWRQDKFGDKPRRTWKEAVVRWTGEMAHKRSLADDIGIVRALDAHLGDKRLDEIGQEAIDALIQALRKQGKANGRINRITALVRAVLRKAEREWAWLDRAPPVRRLKEPAGKVRWLTREEADRLLAELPEHLEAMARFTLATGLRAANVIGLQWQDVDLARRVCWVHPEAAKAGKAIGVPLNNDAVVTLRKQVGKHLEFVFAYKGQPIATAPNNTAWRAALKRAGIEDFRWHDLRHTWASWHVQAGTPLHVLKELGGWASYQMVLRYAHLAPEHLAEHADRISRMGVVGAGKQEAIRTLSGTPGNGQRKSG